MDMRIIDSIRNFVGDPGASGKYTRLLQVIALAALVAAILGGGIWFYLSQERELRHTREEELLAVARLKVDQIAQWRAERVVEAGFITDNPLFTGLAARWMTAQNRQDAELILLRFTSIEKNFKYRDVSLVDVHGTTLLSLHGTTRRLHDDALKYLGISFNTDRPVITDLHRFSEDENPHIDAIAPLFWSSGGSRVPFGAVVLCIDAGQFLYPMIRAWPLPGDTGETLLVRREGAHALYLNELRHKRYTALRLMLPLKSPDLPAAMALKGVEGIFEGTDYRGVRVIAALKSIPGFEWRLIAKIDIEEAMAPWRTQGGLILALIILLVSSSSGGFGLLWQRQKVRHNKAILEAERGRQALRGHFEYLVKYANDIIILADERLSIIEANERALEAYGYGRDEMLGMAITDMIAPDNIEDFHDRIRRLDAEGAIISEALHRKRDGTVFPVEASERFIEVEGYRYFQAIIRDITERKRAEAEIQTAKNFLDNIIEQSPNPIWISNDKGMLIRLNKACCDILKITPEEVVGKYNVLEDNIVEDQGMMPLVRSVFEEGRSVNFDLTYDTALLNSTVLDRSVKVMLNVTMFPVLDSTGKITNAVIQHIDITERKRAEEALRESEERFRTTLDNMIDGGQIIGFDYRYLYVNDTAVRHGRTTREELLGKTMMEAYPGIEKTEMFARLRECMKKRVQHQMDNEFIYPDGSRGWFHLSMQPVPEGVFLLSEDVTEQKRAEEALRESQRRFHETVKNLDEGYYSVTPDGLLLDHNLAFNRILGIDVAQDVRGSQLPDFWQNPDDRMEYLNELMTRGFIRNYMINAKKINGEKIVVMASAHLVKDDKGRMVRIEGTFADFTERKQAEEEIRRLNESLEVRVRERTAQLEEANKELEAFSYSVSHDLRAPLRSIDGFSQVILEDYQDRLDDRGKDHLNRVRAATRRMGRLIDDILKLSRLSRAEICFVQVDLSALARSITDELAVKEPERTVDIVIAENVSAKGDPALLKVAMENLISNAWKFTSGHSRARIEFGIAENDGIKEYFVRDDGAGFDMKYADRLFTPFQRLHGVAEFEGTGIGLALVRRIINRHLGTIRAEGVVEKGAAIYFTLGIL